MNLENVAVQEEVPFYKNQNRIVLEDCGQIDAESVREYIAYGGYSSLEKCLFDMTQDDIVNPDKTFTLDIMEGTYRFMVWSDYVKQGSAEDLYYNAGSFKYFKLYGREDGVKHVGNTDYRDAYIGSQDVEVIRFGGNNSTFTDNHIGIYCSANDDNGGNRKCDGENGKYHN